jgi:diphthamide synthase (EF-2-diphthine--ammonia ligase)
MKIISSWSGGKDSALACYRAMKSGIKDYKVVAK